MRLPGRSLTPGTAADRACWNAGPYRIHGHVGANLDLEKGLRSREEFERWRTRDPLRIFAQRLIAAGLLDEAQVRRISAEQQAEVERAVAQARRDPWPDPDELLDYTLSDSSQPVPVVDAARRIDAEGQPVPHDRLNMGAAICEATEQLMGADERYVIIGQGVNSPWYVGQTTRGLFDRFKAERVIDTPISEDAVSGATVGMAMVGLRPMVVHPRMDFALLAAEQFLGQAANWHYMTGGRVKVPLVARLIVNRGGEQAAQHSQSLQAIFAHVPGLKVVMPSTAYDAKGLLVSAMLSDDPVVYIDDRWAYGTESEVPRDLYTVPLGKGVVRREGCDVTVVATSYLNHLALQAAAALAEEGIEVEVIDPRTIKPLDTDLILSSVDRTGKLLVADGGWDACGVTAEVAAVVAASDVVHRLVAPVKRLGLPPSPAPMSASLEKPYYLDQERMQDAIRTLHQAGRDGGENRQTLRKAAGR